MSDRTADLGIMSALTFAQRTRQTTGLGGVVGKLLGRGGSMAEIDFALQYWEQVSRNATASTQQKLDAIQAINWECQRWLTRKRDKANAMEEGRREVIRQLMQSLAAPAQFLARKDRRKLTPGPGSAAKRAARLHPTTKLKGNYRFEREQYVTQGKQANPYSATLMGDDIDRVQDYGEFVATGARLTEENRAFGADFGVSFFNRAERMKFMLMVREGRFFRADGKPARSEPFAEGNGFNADPYAVDKYGNTYSMTLNKETKQAHGIKQLNHSSFCAGKEVICAGTIACDAQGTLLYITNLSGHYKPNRPQLVWYLRMLHEERVDLSGVCVGAVAPDGQGTQFYRALSFIANPRGPGDWPHTDGPLAVVNGSKLRDPG